MKKSVSLLLSLLMVISIITSVPLTASAASIGDLEFNLNIDGEGYYVSGCKESAKGEIVVPGVYKNQPVTGIGDEAFSNCTKLTSVTISNGVTSIGYRAFYACTSLTSIKISNSVTSIGELAFYKTGYYNYEANWENNVLYIGKHLIAANDFVVEIFGDEEESWEETKYVGMVSGDYKIKSNTKTIADYAFYNCTEITSVTIPSSVTSIGDCAFYNCTSLNSVSIGNGVTTIGDSAFYNCTGLNLIKIPDSVTSIGYRAFYDCTSLKSVSIGDGVTNAGSYTFYNCTNLKSVTIGNSLTNISEYAFAYCTSLKSIKIPDSVTSIDNRAFYDCISLLSITIPDNVTGIGDSAFSGCTSLKSVSIGNGVANIGSNAFEECTSMVSVTIPDNVTSIGSDAFYKCTSLEAVVIGNGVTNIGSYAFYDCTSLASVTIGDSVTRVGEWAFYKCLGLESIIIPDSVASIGRYAFCECTSLEAITIGNGVQDIGKGAFFGCQNLTSVTIPDSVRNIDSDAFYETGYYNDESNWENGVLYINNHLIAANKYDKENFLYIGNASGDYIIRNGTKTIAGSAFANCTDLTSVTISKGVKSIGESAFSNCKSLMSVVIPEGLKNIGSYAFYKCTRFTAITLPDNVTNIGCSAFYNTGFYNDSDNWDEDVLYIDDYLIEAKTSLSGKCIINYGTKTICDSAFENCKKLELIIVPDSVTRIGSYAFKACKSLKSITIPDSVTSIGEDAFRNCTDFTIYGCEDSYAQEYAEENALSFSVHTVHVEGDWIIVEKPSADSVGEKHKECSVCGEVIKTGKVAQLKCNEPALKKVENTTSGVKITWGKVNGGDTYNIYRKTKSGSYSKIGSTKNNYYLDKKAKSGKRYYYIVKAVNEVGSSASSNVKSILYLADPIWRSVSNSEYGVKITWSKVSGAEKYNVYRKTGSGSYSKIATTKKAYYTDKKAKSGKKYSYVVKAVKGSVTSASSSAKSISRIVDSTLKSLSNTKNGVKITWSKVSGAEKYNVYRKTKSGSYSKIGTTKKSYYTDKKAKSGKRYYYIVKAVKGTSTSASSNAKSILHIADPALKSISNSRYGVKITWGKVSGAEKYIVYRKTSKGSYSKIGTTKKPYYTDKKAKSGRKYYYVVKAVKGSVVSASSSSKSILHLADTTLKKPTSTKKGIVLKWSKITGARGYVVYRKTGSGSYSKIATLKGNSKIKYTDKSAKKGKKYTYKVKAYRSKTYSAYSNTKTIKDKY